MSILGIVKVIKDSANNDYIAVDVKSEQLLDYENWLFKNNLEEAHQKKMLRDRGGYHITIVNAFEWRSLPVEKKEKIKFILNKSILVDDFGVGSAENNGNKSWFIVVESKALKKIREILKLREADFHITLAFCEKDVFGVSKNKSVIIDDKVNKKNLKL